MLIVLGVVVGMILFGWAASQWLQRLAHDALRSNRQDFLELAKQELQGERQQGVSDFASQRQAVADAIAGLNKQLETYQQLVRGFESDRDRKYGSLSTELQHVLKSNDQLRNTTAHLTAVLGNSRVRGQWGQKMAEDILRLCGLQEGINYHQEREISAGRPDYTFLLPEGHSLFMDVKFPLDHYLRFTEAQGDEDKQRCREAFIKSVRGHLNEMERRAYGAGEQSVDYTLLFIPNEQVYASLNEWMPQLIDDCLQRKLILCGPWTLYAIVRIIHQAWQNYQFSTAVQDIVKTINGFMKDYSNFKDRFGELGHLLEKLEEKYHEISTTSAQRLDNKIRRIEEYRKGHKLPEVLPETHDPSAHTLTSPEILDLHKQEA